MIDAFDYGGAMQYSKMLEDQISGKNDSWAVRWHASCFLRDLLALYPSRSLVKNIGLDGTGTHGVGADESYDVNVSNRPVSVGGIPIVESSAARDAFRQFFVGGQRETGNQPAKKLRRSLSALVARLRVH